MEVQNRIPKERITTDPKRTKEVKKEIADKIPLVQFDSIAKAIHKHFSHNNEAKRFL